MSSCLLLCCQFFDLGASFAAALLFKMMRRSKSSTPEELSKVLKTFLPNGLGDKYLQPNPEDVAIAYEQVIVEMLMLSARPTQSWITSAVLKTYQTVGSSEAKSFGQQLAQTCQYCFRKKLQVTTRKKVSHTMRRILNVISSAKRLQSPVDMLRHNAALKRKATNENMEPSPLIWKGNLCKGQDNCIPTCWHLKKPATALLSSMHPCLAKVFQVPRFLEVQMQSKFLVMMTLCPMHLPARRLRLCPCQLLLPLQTKWPIGMIQPTKLWWGMADLLVNWK